MRTFADIMLRVALDLGIAKYQSGADNTPVLPTDPATLYRLKDGVRRGRAEFYADFPDSQFRRRRLDFVITPYATAEEIADEEAARALAALTSTAEEIAAANAAAEVTAKARAAQVDEDGSKYALPIDWMGPPQGNLTITGGRGGEFVLTSMERVLLAHAQYPEATGLPELVACEREDTPVDGEESRWILRVWPSPDQEYTLSLRGRWRASDFDTYDVEPTGFQEAIAAYATAYLVSKGLVSTGVGAQTAMQTKLEWRQRVVLEEDKSSPRSLGRMSPPRQAAQQPAIRATNPWAT